MTYKWLGLTTGIWLLLVVTVIPHHSFSAEFDANQPIEVTGHVTKIEWLNPHVWFFIDVENETGAVTTWGWEMGSPNILARRGWSRQSMKIGDIVTAEGSLAKDGSYRANARSVSLTSTGERLFSGSSQGR